MRAAMIIDAAGPEDDDVMDKGAELEDEGVAEPNDEGMMVGGDAAATSRGVSADEANGGAVSICSVAVSRSIGGSTWVGLAGAVGVGAALSAGFARGFSLASSRGGVIGCGADGVDGSVTISSVTIRLVRGGGAEAGTRLSPP